MKYNQPIIQSGCSELVMQFRNYCVSQFFHAISSLSLNKTKSSKLGRGFFNFIFILFIGTKNRYTLDYNQIQCMKKYMNMQPINTIVHRYQKEKGQNMKLFYPNFCLFYIEQRDIKTVNYIKEPLRRLYVRTNNIKAESRK